MNGTVVAASPSAHGGVLTAAGPLGAVGDEQGEREMSVCGSEGLRNSLLEGYQLEYSEVDVVLHYDLSDGRQWKKRVWTRKSYPKKLFRWNTAEEILSYLISFNHHSDWISTTVPQKPPSGSILFFHRKQTKHYRCDGYEWKTRRTTNTVREDRMKLKVGGYQLLYGCYAHSASNQNFHRRSYWLIQNPDLIMVHYLELDCCDGFGARTSPDPLARQNAILELKQSIEPSNWSLLTISDCNLCALLSMVQTSESTKAMLTQLTGVLDQNIQRALALEEAIEMNNTGLPEDMFKDTRSRKMKINNSTANNSSCSCSSSSSSPATAAAGGGGSNKRSMEPNLQAAMNNLCSENQSQGEPSSSSSNNNKMIVDIGSITNSSNTNNSVSTSSVPSTSVASVSLGSTQNAPVLNVLSQSPHIIVCCPKQGSLSYILTLPSSSSSSTAATPTPPGRRILPSGTPIEGSNGIAAKLLSLTKSLSEKNKALSKKSDKVVTGGGGGRNHHQNGFSSSSNVIKDYDAEKFSQFANILVNMDGIGGLHSTEDPGGDTPTHHGHQQQSRTHLLTSSGYDAEFTDSLESESSLQQQGEGSDDRHEEMMDFASIVSSAVGSNPGGVSERESQSILPLLPEVPMSWLKMTTTDHQCDLQPLQPHSTLTTTTTSLSSSSSATTPTVLDSVTNIQPFRSFPLSSSLSTATTTTTLTPAPAVVTIPSVPPQQPNTVTDEHGRSFSDQSQAVCTTQVLNVQVLDQPMADAESLENSQTAAAGDNLLDVSLDLDSESLKHLLSFSQSPESSRSHQACTSTHQHLQPTMTTGEAAPLSPISQLFDRLEPAAITSPGGATLTVTGISQNELTYHNGSNPDHTHSGIHGNGGCVNSQHSLAHENHQSYVSTFGPSIGGGHSPQLAVPGTSADNHVHVSDVWAPSPNSLQLWLESTSGGFDDNILPSTSSESTTTIVASSSHTAQSMDIDDSSDLSSVDLPQDLCDFIAQTDLPLQQPNSTQNSSIQPQYTHHTSQQSHLQQQQQQLHSSSGLTFESRDGYNSGSNVGVLECDFGISHHHSDPSQHALYDSTEHFPGPFDVFCAHPDRSVGSYQDDTSGQRQPQRKTSNTSICSEPLPFDSLRVPPTMFGGSDLMASNRHHLSLPNLANLDTNEQGQSSSSLLEPTQGGSPIPCGSGGFTSSPCSHRSISPGVALPDIPEGVQIRSPMTQFDPAQFNMDLLQYRTSSPVPSSPSIASVSSRSTVSTHEFFDSESPSVLELCEMLSESPNVRHQDFSHMVLTEAEQRQLFRSAQVIQNAFRSYKSRRQLRDKEKSAALLIENYYKNYVQMKHEKERAARRIQQQYRIYKTRTKELNRAAVFIQQMYRYQKHRKVPDNNSYNRPPAVSGASQLQASTPPTTDPT